MTFPINEFSKLSLEPVVNTKFSDKARYNRSRGIGAKRDFWMISVTNPPVPYREGMGIGAVLNSYRGGYEITALPNPFPALEARTGLRINSASLDESTTIEVKNLPISNSVAMAGGDFINISGHPKVYQIVFNVSSNSSGVGTATITPPLFQDVPSNTEISYGEDVVFQVCLDDVVSAEVDAKAGKFMVFSFDLMEQG